MGGVGIDEVAVGATSSITAGGGCATFCGCATFGGGAAVPCSADIVLRQEGASISTLPPPRASCRYAVGATRTANTNTLRRHDAGGRLRAVRLPVRDPLVTPNSPRGCRPSNARDRHSCHAERFATRADADSAAEHGRQRASVDDAASTHDTRTHQSQPRITGAFPNQAPSRKNDQGSGLLGGKV